MHGYGATRHLEAILLVEAICLKWVYRRFPLSAWSFTFTTLNDVLIEGHKTLLRALNNALLVLNFGVEFLVHRYLFNNC